MDVPHAHADEEHVEQAVVRGDPHRQRERRLPLVGDRESEAAVLVIEEALVAVGRPEKSAHNLDVGREIVACVELVSPAELAVNLHRPKMKLFPRSNRRAAIAKVMELAPKRPKDHLMVINLSGRGDKDVPQVGELLRGKQEVTTRIFHLSPWGRGRLRSSRVRGLIVQSNRSDNSIISRTPSRLSYTSMFETRTMWNPQASSTGDRALSRLTSDGRECVTPSTSTINFHLASQSRRQTGQLDVGGGTSSVPAYDCVGLAKVWLRHWFAMPGALGL